MRHRAGRASAHPPPCVCRRPSGAGTRLHPKGDTSRVHHQYRRQRTEPPGCDRPGEAAMTAPTVDPATDLSTDRAVAPRLATHSRPARVAMGILLAVVG